MQNRKAFFEAVQPPAELIDTSRCALLFSQAINPALDLQQAEAALDSLCEDARECKIDSAESLLHFVHQKNRFSGNPDEYYAVENSLLDHVIERRIGIPISLALIYLAVGKTSGLSVYGIGFPGHFLVGVKTNGYDSTRNLTLDARFASDAIPGALIDPFAGRLVSRGQCFNLLDQLYQGRVEHNDSYFAACGNDTILLRLIENVKGIYLKQGEAENALTCLDYQLMIAPQETNLLSQQQQLLSHLQEHGGDASIIH
jgi:regulator of sirC expression with transglutaminase-like and TPR domain